MRVLNTLSGDMCTVQYRCVCVCRCKTELSPAQSAAQSPALSPGWAGSGSSLRCPTWWPLSQPLWHSWPKGGRSPDGGPSACHLLQRKGREAERRGGRSHQLLAESVLHHVCCDGTFPLVLRSLALYALWEWLVLHDVTVSQGKGHGDIIVEQHFPTRRRRSTSADTVQHTQLDVHV